MDWLYMIVPLYITYYTFVYAKLVWQKEENPFAAVVISILAISITALSIWLKVR